MIETERLVLRPWRGSDRDAFFAIVGDPAVGEWLGGARSADEAGAEFDRMTAFWAEHGQGWLAIEAKDEGRVVGRVCVRRVLMEWNHPRSGDVEVGWALARAAWGRGYATEAAAAMLAWGFRTLAVPEIFAWTAVGNLRSQAVMQRLGMTRRPDLDFDHPDLAEDHPLQRHVVFVAKR